MDQGRATRWSRAKHIPCSFFLLCSLLPAASFSLLPYTTKCKEEICTSRLLLSWRENKSWWLLFPQISSCEIEPACVSGSQAAVLNPSHLQPALVLVWVWFLCVIWFWCMDLKFHMLKVVDNVYLQILKNRWWSSGGNNCVNGED